MIMQQGGMHPIQRPETTAAEAAAAQVKTVHEYYGIDGHVKVELFTPSQLVPTYMGGTQERGRGALHGRVLYTPTSPTDKVSHISIKVKCVILVRTPASNSHESSPNAITDRTPTQEKVVEKETLALHLGQKMYANKEGKDVHAEAKQLGSIPSSVVNTLPHPDLTPDENIAAFGFKIDLPRDNKDGDTLPPSFVLTAGEHAHGSSPPSEQAAGDPSVADAKRLQEGGLFGGRRGFSLRSSGQNSNLLPPDRHHWACVKWYTKVTIGRPGMLQGNDRVLIPFQFLPPPPQNLSALINLRAMTSIELRQNKPVRELLEASDTWLSSSIGPDVPDPCAQKRGFYLFSRKKMIPSNLAFEMPPDPAAFPVQGSIPFAIVSKVMPASGDQAPLFVALYRKVTISGRKDSQAIDERVVCRARTAVTPAMEAAADGSTMYRWYGVLDLPANATPSFTTKAIEVSYYIGAVEAFASEPQPNKKKKSKGPVPLEEFVYTKAVQICCPPPSAMAVVSQDDGRDARPIFSPPPPPSSLLPPIRVSKIDKAVADRPAADAAPGISHMPAARGQTSLRPVAQSGVNAHSGSIYPSQSHTTAAAAAAAAAATTTATTTATATTALQSAISPGAPAARLAAQDAELLHDGAGLGLGLPPSYFETMGIRDDAEDE